MPAVKMPLDLQNIVQNVAPQQSNESENKASSSSDCNHSNGNAPMMAEGDDSGKGESSDGDSPMSPKEGMPGVEISERSSSPRITGSESSTGKTSSKSVKASNSKSPRKGGCSRAKASGSGATKSNGTWSETPTSVHDTRASTTRKSNYLVTQAEIYENVRNEPPTGLESRSVPEGGSETLEMTKLPKSYQISKTRTASLDTIDEHGDNKCDELEKTWKFANEAVRNDSNDSTDTSRRSIVSSSDVRIQSTGLDKATTILDQRDSDYLSPVTEV